MASQTALDAEKLLRTGRAQDAVSLLGTAAARGDPDALMMLAELCLVGSVVHRDLSLSRDLFRRAAEAGSPEGAAVYRAFVANGTGAPPDWPKAIELLETAAPTDPSAARELALISNMNLTADGAPLNAIEGETLSSSPEVRLFRGLFSPGECDFLIDVAIPRMGPSVVVDPRSGQQVPNPVRTSDGAAFPLAGENPAMHALCMRLAAASDTRVEQGEPLQILRYSPGQEFRPHFDSIHDTDNQRILTFLVYLNDDYEGGETQFLATGLKVRGRKGDGLLFRNADEAGRPDPQAQHSGLPPTTGQKFLASRWIRQRPVLVSRT